MQKERFTRKQFDDSRDLLRSSVSEFHFSLFEALEHSVDLRFIFDEDDDSGDCFYVFLKKYGTCHQYESFRSMYVSELEQYIFNEFIGFIDSPFDIQSALLFSINGVFFSVVSLSLYKTVELLVFYLKNDFITFHKFSFHSLGNISFGSIGKDGHFVASSVDEFEERQPTLFYYLRKNGLL